MEEFEILNNVSKQYITVDAKDENMKVVIKFVLDTLTITEQRFISNISVIVEEAYVNIAHYSGSEKCYVTLGYDEDFGYLLLEDDGAAFDPLEVNNDPYSTANMAGRMGGLGILMIKRMSKGVWYRRFDNKNQLLIKLARR